MDEEHVLDKALGDIHQCAIQLQFIGLTDFALVLAEAHEAIQNYLIKED